MSAARFPCLCPLLQVYTALTDGRGQVPVRLVLTDADEELGPLAVAEGTVKISDPTRTWEVLFQLKNVLLPRGGQYRLQLFAGEDLLRELRLYVALVGTPQRVNEAGGIAPEGPVGESTN
jgi:hypothetical protein